MARIVLVSGASRLELEDDNCETVADVLRLYRDSLNIPANASVTVNGDPADADTALSDGDEVAASKPTGTKGA